MNNFDKIFPDLLRDEGGYSNTPGDHGGPTKYGITIGDVRKYINADATAIDVKNLTVDQAKSIYKKRYWDALDCDNLASGVDYTCFDYGVNSGLGRPKADLVKFKDKSGVDLINAINDERKSFLTRLANKPDQAQFRTGWLNRVERVRSKSLEMAKSTLAGPVTGGIVGAGTVAVAVGQQHFWQLHPYVTVGIAIGIAISVGYLVHIIRNKGNKNA